MIMILSILPRIVLLFLHTEKLASTVAARAGTSRKIRHLETRQAVVPTLADSLLERDTTDNSLSRSGEMNDEGLCKTGTGDLLSS